MASTEQKRAELHAEPRAVSGKREAKLLRSRGIIPGTVYGQGATQSIQVPLKQVQHIMAHGATGLISLTGLGTATWTVLCKEIGRDPLTGLPTNVQLQTVSADEQITAAVPLHFIGESPAVKLHGGSLLHPTTSVQVSARSDALPTVIEVDISALQNVRDSLHVTDLPSLPGVRYVDPPDMVVATVQAPIAAEVTAEATAPAVVASPAPAAG